MNSSSLSQDPVFADLEPIEQVEAQGALVPILYSPDCASFPPSWLAARDSQRTCSSSA